MANTSGPHLLPGQESKSHTEPVAMTPSYGKLEDILNDLHSLETPKRATELRSTDYPVLLSRSPELSTRLPSPGKEFPLLLRQQLKLGQGAEAIYQGLLAFQQANRFKPVLELDNGLVVYVEFDIESERIRLFVGNRNEYMTLPRGPREMSGLLVIDEIFEYKIECKTSEFLGFKRKGRTVIERYKAGSELLRGNDLLPGRKVFPVLHFSIFADKSCGISTCAVKAECLKG